MRTRPRGMMLVGAVTLIGLIAVLPGAKPEQTHPMTPSQVDEQTRTMTPSQVDNVPGGAQGAIRRPAPDLVVGDMPTGRATAAPASHDPSLQRADHRAGEPTFAVSLYLQVPAPGHPFGIAVHDGQLVVSTSAGQPMPWGINTMGERIFTFDGHRHLVRTLSVDEGPAANMGLGGVAFDGDERLYVADMNNGLVRRYSQSGSEETFAAAPMTPCPGINPSVPGQELSVMWNDVVFDPRGNAYVSDICSRIWRITPTREVSIWFSDLRLSPVGPFQEQVDASGTYLYFANGGSVHPDHPGCGSVYRLPLTDHPGAGDLRELHCFPSDASDLAPDRVVARGPVPGADPNGIALGKSGRIYVALGARDQLAVLSPSGELIRTISSPLFHFPEYLTFAGDRLLVTNNDTRANSTPDGSAVLSVDVGDTGVAPFEPGNVR